MSASVSELGSRRNPLVVTEPAHMAAAARRVEAPSEPKKTAGNYTMAHIIVGGLEITIETPMGHIREGKGRDGKPWQVRMPADYGYIKRSEGADGDHIDVYIGPHAHEVDTKSVWVVDQIDADSRAFDEHKCMLGFHDAVSARRTYEGGFSDGRGKERIGAVTRMTWPGFMHWLTRGENKKPVAYAPTQKSASAITGYGGSLPSCSCGGACTSCSAPRGVPMAKSTEAGTEVSPSAAGFVSKALAGLWATLSPSDRVDLLASAASNSSAALAKAHELFERGDDGGRIRQVEDLWDGPPDDRLEVGGGSGPGSSAPAGKVNVGPRQSASGDGALRMERHYSRHAPQHGVEQATIDLGNDLAKAINIIKSLLGYADRTNERIGLLETVITKSAAPAAAAAPAELDAMIAKAIAAAQPAMMLRTAGVLAKSLVLAKAEEEEEEEGGRGEEEEEEVAKAVDTLSKSEIDIEVEDEEGDKDKEGEKEAAKARIIAKSLLRMGTRSLRKAKEAEEDKDEKEWKGEMEKARRRLAKSQVYLEVSKSIRGVTGPSAKAITKLLKAAAKECKASENQVKWATGPAAKSADATAVAGAAAAGAAPTAEQFATIQKAVAGMGTMLTDMQGLMTALSRQPASGSHELPPVFALAKAKPQDLQSIEGEIREMASTNVISLDEADRATDVIHRARRGQPVDAMIAQLAVPVQNVINARLAA